MKPVLLLMLLHLSIRATSGAGAGPAGTSVPPAINALGVDLYRALASQGEGNLLLSPYSIEVALAMAQAGADGETKTEIQRVLHLTGPDEVVAKEFAALAGRLQTMAEASNNRVTDAKKRGGPSTPIEINIASRLFVQQSFALSKAFTSHLADLYRAPLQQLDFRNSSEKSRGAINQWVEQQTRKKIRDLIPAGGIAEETRVVLANAIYLRAAWEDEFFDGATSPQRFLVKGKDAVDVPTMVQTASYGYAKRKGFTAINMPYVGGELSLLIVLPEAENGLGALEKELTPDLLANEAKNARQEVELHLPKFRIEPPTVPLGEVLQGLGMKTAFDQPRGTANFDRMALRKPNEYLYISQVFHKAFLALDEKGTEAAAATVVSMPAGSAFKERKAPPVVRVDHPFLFAIQHVQSGTCLFLGRVNDPR